MKHEYYLEGLIKTTRKCTLKIKGSELEEYESILAELINIFYRQKQDKGKRIFFIGNGGSAAIATHMTADFLNKGGMTTVGMYDPATITCIGNDYGYEFVFSKQLEMHIKRGDLLVAVSSSGNSPNILRAISTAEEKGAHVLTFTGFKPDNKARQMGDYNLYVPSMEYGIVESVHNIILQQIVDNLE